MFFFKMTLWISALIISCTTPNQSKAGRSSSPLIVNFMQDHPIPAAHHLSTYLPLLKNKKVGMVVNQTSMIGSTHIVDTLLKHQIKISKIFSPEHGFRGEADAGEKVNNAVDQATGILLVSLYGEKRKPSPDDLKDLDIIVFDIQDIGVRFYTYIATLALVMEACGEQHKPLIILDRPNPNGYYVDGPLLSKAFQSFVGMHPVPIVYGLTIGEYGKMVNGEGWLANKIKCDLKVILCGQYDHTMLYDLPIKPSPNIVNHRATLLYPSTCLFEGTNWSEGRGTTAPFIVFGHPKYSKGDYTFTPVSLPGAKSPKLLNQPCQGHNLSYLSIDEIKSWKKLNFKWLLQGYQDMKDKESFFLANNFFNKLAGNAELMAQIKAGKSEDEIRASWKADLYAYKVMRKKYLLYKDFE